MTDSNWRFLLKDRFGIDFPQMIECLGHPGGIYEDTALLLSLLVSAPQINNVLEIGSGLSTLVLAHMCSNYNKYLVTIEDDPRWAETANASIRALGLDFEVTSNKGKLAYSPDFGDLQFDLAWIDGTVFGKSPGKNVEVDYKFLGRVGGCNYYAPNLQNAVLIFDDVQTPVIKRDLPLLDGFPEFSPVSPIYFNPKGRSDRHQAIYLPEGREYFIDTVRGALEI